MLMCIPRIDASRHRRASGPRATSSRCFPNTPHRSNHCRHHESCDQRHNPAHVTRVPYCRREIRACAASYHHCSHRAIITIFCRAPSSRTSARIRKLLGLYTAVQHKRRVLSDLFLLPCDTMWFVTDDSPSPPPPPPTPEQKFSGDLQQTSEDSTDSVSKIVAAILRQCQDDDNDDENAFLLEQLFGPVSSGLWPVWPQLFDTPPSSAIVEAAQITEYCTATTEPAEATKTAEIAEAAGQPWKRLKTRRQMRWRDQELLFERIDYVSSGTIRGTRIQIILV